MNIRSWLASKKRRWCLGGFIMGSLALCCLNLVWAPQLDARYDVLLGDERHGTTLVWLFTPNAYASCRQPAYALRKVSQIGDDPFRLIVRYTAQDKAQVERLLTRERLHATLLPLDAQEYERLFQRPAEPGLYVFREGHLVQSWAYGSRAEVVDEDALAALLQE